MGTKTRQWEKRFRNGCRCCETPISIPKQHRKKQNHVLGNAKPVLRVKLKRGWYVFWWFFTMAHVQPYHSKGLGESFTLMWLNIGLCWKIREQCVFWRFFKIGICSAIPFKRSWRELYIDVAEHMSIFKNNQNTHYPRFSYIPKTGIAFPKTGFSFLLWAKTKGPKILSASSQKRSKIIGIYVLLSLLIQVLSFQNQASYINVIQLKNSIYSEICSFFNRIEPRGVRKSSRMWGVYCATKFSTLDSINVDNRSKRSERDDAGRSRLYSA